MKIKEINKNKSNNKTQRNQLWDIVKSIGIISIVIGHTCPIAVGIKFVYTYHLIIFYFIAGYFYKEEKYGDRPFEYFCYTLRKNWIKYMFWSIIIIIFHNFFVTYNFYGNMEKYNIDNYIMQISNSIVLKNSELFAGALWFIPTLIFASGIFAFIIYIARKISFKIENYSKIKICNINLIKYILIILLSVIIGGIGVILNQNKWQLNYDMHTSLLVLPIYSLAYFYKIIENKIKKIDKLYIWIIAFILSASFLYYMAVNNEVLIELADEKIINWYMFYIVSIIGLCFCISISKIINMIPVISNVFSNVGKSSFSIMSLHFICIKLVDVIYSYYIKETNPEVISKWVSAYPQKLWIIYVIVGVIVPVLVTIILNKIKEYSKKNKVKEA